MAYTQVFAYGQTGAGKTHVMGTAATFRHLKAGVEADGVIPRTISAVCQALEQARNTYEVTLKVCCPHKAQGKGRVVLHSSMTRLLQSLIAAVASQIIVSCSTLRSVHFMVREVPLIERR